MVDSKLTDYSFCNLPLENFNFNPLKMLHVSLVWYNIEFGSLILDQITTDNLMNKIKICSVKFFSRVVHFLQFWHSQTILN